MGAPPGPEPGVGVLLARTARALGRADRRSAAARGLSDTALGVLGALLDGEAASHRELGAALGVAPATLTPVLDQLERAGAVLRRRDPHDRRAVRVSITERGRRRLTAAAAAATPHAVPAPDPAHEPVIRAYLLGVLAALDRGPSP